MARDRDSDGLGANQSKKPPAADVSDQPQQHPPQQQYRAKGQKHVVGGRPHARNPSSKGVQKHHAATSTAKLNRRHGSLSPDRGPGAAIASHHHRRATSELKLSRDPSASNLKKNTSQTNLKRNRSQAEVGKKTKSAINLQRSISSPAVHKLRSSGGSKVQFNLGDEEQNGDQDDDDEWVDASTSASPLLSRRGSAVSSAYTTNAAADDEDSLSGSPTPHAELQRTLSNGAQSDSQNGTQNGATDGSQYSVSSLPRNNKIAHNEYLTSRILSRTSSHGAPPMMSTENASARPSSLRQQSPPDSSPGPSQYLSNTPVTTAQARPGSSGKAELTSRFVGNNSQEPGSGIAGESFMLAAHRNGPPRVGINIKDEISVPKRRRSAGALSQARGIDALNARRAAAENASDDEEEEERMARVSRSRRSGEYALPREMNRTQQKLNLQRASSSLEPPHPHPGIGMGPPSVTAGTGPLIGVPTAYDARDPRVNKALERTGMEYLTVRRHLNPVARSIARVMQLPGLENSRRIPRPGTAASSHHASRLSEQYNPNNHRDRDRDAITRNSSMADLINGSGSGGRRPPTPRSGGGGGGGGVFSTLQSASSSLGTDDDDGASRMHERQGHVLGNGHGNGHSHAHGHGHGLSGTSLVDGAEDAGTLALLRMMWEKNMDLSASQD
ncbi:uncharacterized protein B0H64DRAFT_407005 [Chaetomium fimeti]|uniref:Uncharacterized protein n=1 Tax=Chaetomium fimeti TaxID=1854472 RepID=A0AAE0H9M8_9PEZI|nr:hypothetical protein B0H64DRAFT_407005 [Chaetomium fimeti]